MIPRTFPSIIEAFQTKMVVYVLPSISGLKAWIDYIPVKGVVTEDPVLANTYANAGYQVVKSQESLTGQAWLDYIPVFEDASFNKPWSTDAGGYIPVGGLFSPASLFANGEQGWWFDPSNFSTLFQDSAGTTPVTAVEQPVGLQLDLSATAVPGYYSGFFDGTGDYLSAATNTAFDIGSVDFTIECWVNSNSFVASQGLVSRYNFSGGTGTGWAFLITASTNIRIIRGNDVLLDSTVSALLTGTWYHLAVVRQGTTLTTYLNGVQVGQALGIANFTDASTSLQIGRTNTITNDLNGYISNVRVVKGTAVYTAAFTPPTAPLTAISGTSLLTCQNNYFKDNSSNAFAVTANGNANPNLLNPFGSTAARSVNHRFQTTSANRPVVSARVNLLERTEDFANAYWTKNSLTITSGVADPNGGLTAFTFTAATANASISRNIGSLVAGSPITCYIRRRTGTGAIALWTGATYQTITAAAFWEPIVVTQSTLTTGFFDLRLSVSGDAVDVWHPDVRVTNQGVGLPVYQRVNTSTDYDSTGFPIYIKPNGSNQFMQTNSINFTATDKMTVWQGVRKVGVTGTVQLVTETSVTSDSNAGSFALGAPIVGKQYYFQLNAGSRVDGSVSSGYDSPVTNVVTYLMNIAGAVSADEIKARINSVDVSLTFSGSPAGTGNFGNYPAYFYARAGTSLYFNGNDYGSIARGAASTAAQIANGEAYINSKTKAYTL